MEQTSHWDHTAEYVGFGHAQTPDHQDVRWAVNVLLEKIAEKFEGWETLDLWRSDAAATVRSFKHTLSDTSPDREPAPCAWTGYLPDEHGNLFRRWGFGHAPDGTRDVRLLYSFPPNAEASGFALCHPDLGVSITTVCASRAQAEDLLQKHPKDGKWQVAPVTCSRSDTSTDRTSK